MAIQASLTRCRAVRFSGFFHSAYRAAPDVVGRGCGAGSAGRVPHAAAHVVEGLGGPGHDVERVQADARRWGSASRTALKIQSAASAETSSIWAHRCWAEFGEELAEDGLAAPFGDPQQLTGVVVDHDGEEFEAPPVGDLVHAYTA